MITGLTRADSGHATIEGRPFAELANPARTVGTLLDAAAFHNGRTGLETLRIACTVAGLRRSRAGELLDRVGLAVDAERPVGAYSLGMRQRLGLAHALVGQPSVLILDEPANGLDPEGIAWIRELLRDFARRGGTVLLSSHLLTEIQATADRLVIIDHGRVIASGTQHSLLAGSGQSLEELFLSLTAAKGRAA
jgi:ABC-2 type transport system ATP-binding protein